jgi:cephalosporin hydroxylase
MNNAAGVAPSPEVARFLRENCAIARKKGEGINLDQCCYGEKHRGDGLSERPLSYYYFLAGLVNHFQLKRVFEVGTHYGGSIRSMIRGLTHKQDRDQSLYVTADVNFYKAEAFGHYPDTLVRRFHGDAGDAAEVEKVRKLFGEEPIDMLYIDAIHSYDGTAHHINLYTNSLRPRFIVLDDIHLNHEMERLWTDMVKIFGDQAYDATNISGRGESGFGIIMMRS